MAKTNAQRQSEYRRNQKEGTHKKGEPAIRINTFLDADAHFALERLSKYYAVTKRELIEKMLIEADSKILKSLSEDNFEPYLNRTLRSNTEK